MFKIGDKVVVIVDMDNIRKKGAIFTISDIQDYSISIWQLTFKEPVNGLDFEHVRLATKLDQVL